MSIVVWLTRIINNQEKTVYHMRVNEDSVQARSSESLKTIFEQGITIETTGGCESTSNYKVERPM